MIKPIKYAMNGFPFQYSFFVKNIGFDFAYIWPNILTPDYFWKTIKIDDGTEYKYLSGTSYIFQNLKLLHNLYRRGEMKQYDIVQINNTENFLLFRPSDSQVSIAESHGFDFWVNYARYLQDEKNLFLKIFWWIIDKLIGWRVRQKIQQFDLYYCSTPDMLESLRRIRPDVKWLPNPINTNIFNPEGNIIKLEWNPACFFPTRLHGDKKPEYAIRIFQEYIKPKFPEATLHLLNQWFEVEKYKKELFDEKTYFWHDFMDKETLAAKIRGSDFCFWDFSIGGLSLMPMQIMACRKPIVTYDMHELIKVEREDLWELTKKIFEDREFSREYVERNYKYIQDMHTEESICRMHIENLKPIIKRKLNVEL